MKHSTQIQHAPTAISIKAAIVASNAQALTVTLDDDTTLSYSLTELLQAKNKTSRIETR